MPNTCAVIFDMDGVLIDSYLAHYKSWQLLAAEQKCEYSEQDFVKGFGRTSVEVLAEQWPEQPLTEDRIRELADRKEDLFREIIGREFPAMEGAESLIQSLSNTGVPMAVGSSGPRVNVEFVLEKVGVRPLVSVCVTGEDVARGKPDPQVFQLAAKRLDVAPDFCVVIEDAPVGIEAARAAGMKCVGLASTGRTVSELREADLVIRSVSELNLMRLEMIAQGKRGNIDGN